LAVVERPTHVARIYEDCEALASLMRDSMLQAGLGETDPKAPLADIIRAGDTVLLKPNWVLHKNPGGGGMDCMVTHPAFILAALRQVLAAGAGRVIIADAPIQVTQFDVLVTAAWRRQVAEAAGATPVKVLDLRDTVTTLRGRRMTPQAHRRDPDRFILFDLGSDSLLEPISKPEGNFRCSQYDPDDLRRVQRPGVHRFLLCKEAFEADVVINLPKLKTHGKAGVTAALKNLVGINGDKNYLPHHRVGGSAAGGDCYEGHSPLKRAAESLIDAANRRIGRRGYLPLTYAALIAKQVHGDDLGAKWAGNDTTWRMVLDLNRIALYGRLDGTLADEPQRRLLSLTDALVAGEHNGPLRPEPVPLGAVTFAADPAHADAVHLALMRFDRSRVPLVREAFAEMRYPITNGGPTEASVRCGGASYSLDEVADLFGRDFRPPDGWVGRV
jgi:uncharacterized protein (DUF362 family)